MQIHGPADIHQQQKLRGILSAFHPYQFKVTGIFAGSVNRSVKIEFVFRTNTAQVAKPFKRHFDLPDIEGEVAAVIFKLSFPGDFCRRTVPRFSSRGFSDIAQWPKGDVQLRSLSPPWWASFLRRRSANGASPP
jgi:hypothetical protein